MIDLIQVYVEALDRLFENVCELDLIFNFETLHATLSEMIVGGVVIETHVCSFPLAPWRLREQRERKEVNK